MGEGEGIGVGERGVWRWCWAPKFPFVTALHVVKLTRPPLAAAWCTVRERRPIRRRTLGVWGVPVTIPNSRRTLATKGSSAGKRIRKDPMSSNHLQRRRGGRGRLGDCRARTTHQPPWRSKESCPSPKCQNRRQSEDGSAARVPLRPLPSRDRRLDDERERDEVRWSSWCATG